MAIEGINSNQIATAQAAITPQKSEAKTPTPAKTTAVPSPAYTVELTGTALAKSLKQSGQNPAQIALKMGIDLKTVDQYLSIKVATVAPKPAPATTTIVTAQPSSPAEEAKEPTSEKAAETAQGKK